MRTNFQNSEICSNYQEGQKDMLFRTISFPHQNYHRLPSSNANFEQGQLYLRCQQREFRDFQEMESPYRPSIINGQQQINNRNKISFMDCAYYSHFQANGGKEFRHNWQNSNFYGTFQSQAYFLDQKNRHNYQNPQFQIPNRQLIMQIPSLNDPDPYAHYLFLKSIFQNQEIVLNSQLKCYLIEFLAQQNCPFPYSALSFLLQRTDNILTDFAKHEIQYIVKILNTKYPYDIDYSQQFKKIENFDKNQSEKLRHLMALLTLFWRRLQRTDLYTQFMLNYLLVSSMQLQNAKTSQQNVEEKRQIMKQIQLGIEQLLQIGFYLSFPTKMSEKLAKLFYNIIPSEQIMTENQNQQRVRKYICNIYYKSFPKLSHQQCINDLFLIFKKILIKEMGNISAVIGKIQGSLQSHEQIKSAFEQFSFKVLNIIGLRLWNRLQILQYSKIINSCQFLCGFHRQQYLEQYENIIQYAVETIQHKKVKVKDYNVQSVENRKFQTFELQDSW